MGAPDEDGDMTYLSYEEFGRRFFELAAAPERVTAAFREMTSRSVDIEPFGAGPGHLAEVTARVDIGKPVLEQHAADEIHYDVAIPIRVHLMVDVSVDKPRFDVDGHVSLRLTVRGAEPLRVVIDIDEPSSDDVYIDVQAETLRGSLLREVAGVDDEIKRFVASYVATEIEKPYVLKARQIDVIEQIDRALSPAEV